MSYFQRGGSAAVTDILRASWVAFSMVKDAFSRCESGFYSAFYTGQKPSIISLEDASDDSKTSHAQIPQEIIDLTLALR